MNSIVYFEFIFPIIIKINYGEKMKIIVVVIIIIVFILNNIAYAVIENEETFVKNGGDLKDITHSIKTVNEKLRQKSFADPFYSVGTVAGCTATWLGEDNTWSYILTAAHCYEYSKEVNPAKAAFMSWNNEYIAAGEGFFYVHPLRLKTPNGMYGAATDIGIFKLPKIAHPKDAHGKPIVQPIVYDLKNELNKAVEFVGYGMWGVGLDVSGMYYPDEGPRRLWGQSQIDQIIELEHALCAGYEKSSSPTKWVRMAPGDSGCSWWQIHKETKTIIAVTNGGGDCISTGTRISQYAHWIKSIFPNVSLFSQNH